MRDQRDTINAREVLARALSPEEGRRGGDLAGKKLLDTLDEAISKLSSNFSYNSPFTPGGASIVDYHKMFSDISEDFSKLTKELSDMRSSYLPKGMAEASDSFAQDQAKELNVILNEEPIMESYENAFFRLLGMPLVSDIQEMNLATVSRSGEFRDHTHDQGFSRTAPVLDERSLPVVDRATSPSSSSYEFLNSSKPPLARLTEMGFPEDKMDALKDVLLKMKELSKRTLSVPGEQSFEVAKSLKAKIEENTAVDQRLATFLVEEVSQDLDKIISLTNLQNLQLHNLQERASFTNYLKRVLYNTLTLFDPGIQVSTDLTLLIWDAEIAGVADKNLLGLQEPTNFWNYAYLLFPPVQDSRIAGCLSEPSKMVAEPFLPESMRKVDGKRLRSTLLEAVIRIRLDIISGFPPSTPRVSAGGMTLAQSDEDGVPLTPDSMGFLEALLITRLFTALQSMAEDVTRKVQAIHRSQHRSGVGPANERRGTPNAQPTPEKRAKTVDELELEALLAFEESLLVLFGDGSIPEALDLQEGIARSSGTKDSHFMSAALSILDIPRRWAEGELEKISEQSKRDYSKRTSPASGTPRTLLGLERGVGAIDLLAFMIGMFTMSEDMLLSLLNERQKANLKRSFPEDFFINFKALGDSSETIAAAVDELSERAYDAYQLFRFMLNPSNTSRSFNNAPPK